MKRNTDTYVAANANGVQVPTGHFATGAASIDLSASNQAATTPINIITACGGSQQLNLPAANSVTPSGMHFYVCNKDSAGSDNCDIGVTGCGSNCIFDESLSLFTTVQITYLKCMILVSDGSTYYVVAKT